MPEPAPQPGAQPWPLALCVPFAPAAAIAVSPRMKARATFRPPATGMLGCAPEAQPGRPELQAFEPVEDLCAAPSIQMARLGRELRPIKPQCLNQPPLQDPALTTAPLPLEVSAYPPTPPQHMSTTEAHRRAAPAAPRLPAAPQAQEAGKKLLAASFRAEPAPVPCRGAGTRNETFPLDLRPPALRQPSITLLPASEVLQAEPAVAEEVHSADATAALRRASAGHSLGSPAVLPALASLFRYGQHRYGFRPAATMAHGLAPSDRRSLPMAFREMAMPGPQMAVPSGNELSIVETFEYVRPLSEPPFDLVQRLLRLWRVCPACVRYASAAACLILLLWLSSPAGGVTNVVAAQWGKFQEGVQNRAAVELAEDFRHGLASWTAGDEGTKGWRIERAGYVKPGKLALYEPSLQMQDYRMEFLFQIEKQAIGWVYRAADHENYYATKITIVKPGPLPLLALVRYPVIGGKEGPRVEAPIRVLMHNNVPYRVQMSVNGRNYSTSIEGQLVDFWSDDRLKAGGVGFFGDSGESARVYWMKLSRNDDFIGRVCAYFYPNPLQAMSLMRHQ